MFVSHNGVLEAMPTPQVKCYIPTDSSNADSYHIVAYGSQKIITPHINYTEWKEKCTKYPFGYTLNLFCTNPEWVESFAHKAPLKIMYFDIEVGTDGSGLFPKPERNPIIMIGLQFDNEPIIILDDYSDEREDRDILAEFFKLIKEHDPDVVTGFNSWSFDMPYIVKRAIRHFGGDESTWSHAMLGRDSLHVNDGTDKSLALKTVDAHISAIRLDTKTRARVGRRIHYDIYRVDVIRDQKLMGIKNRKMKTLGKHFLKEKADEVIELDHMENLMAMMKSKDGKSELIKYLKSDVWVTHELSDIYFKTDIEAAESLSVPLEFIVSRSNGTISVVYMLKRALQEKILPIRNNEHNYADMYALSKANGSPKDYQGAYVDIFAPNTRVDKPIYKIDFRCVDKETEILTEEGWKSFKDVEVGDKVAAFDITSKLIQWEKCTEVHDYHYDGEMIHIKNRLTDQMLTPNHRVVFRRARPLTKEHTTKKRYSSYIEPDVYHVINADHLPTYVKIPVAAKLSTLTSSSYEQEVRAELFGLIIAEGYLAGKAVCISQTNANPQVVERIDYLIETLGWSNQVTKRERHRCTGRATIEYAWRILTKLSLKELTPQFGDDIHHIPSHMLLEPEPVRLALFKGLMDGDGTWKSESAGCFRTKRKGLADQFQQLCCTLGYRSSIRKSRHHKQMYYINICCDRSYVNVGLNRTIQTKDKLYKKVDYNGKVYCVTVPSGFIMCRRNGKTFITGNSLYPSLIRTFNLSYETVEYDPDTDLLPLSEADPEEYGIEKRTGGLTLYIPDMFLQRRLRISIDMSEKGLVPRIVDELMEERAQLKGKLKEVEHALETAPNSIDLRKQQTVLDSRQNICKIVMNSMYGILANRYSIGYLPIGITITAMGRWIIKYVVNRYREHCLEVDTDGILMDIDPGIDAVNAAVKDIVKRTFGIDDCTLEMEIERFERGYIYKMKNYLLIKKSDIRDPKTNKIIGHKENEIIHGAVFKSSRASKVYDDAIRCFLDWALHHKRTKEQVVKDASDIDNRPLSDFVSSVRLSKNIYQYGMTPASLSASEGIELTAFDPAIAKIGYGTVGHSLVVQLARKYRNIFGITPSASDVIDYVAILNPLTGKREYEPYNPNNPSLSASIDIEYYREKITSRLGEFGMPVEQRKITAVEELGSVWDTIIEGVRK